MTGPSKIMMIRHAEKPERKGHAPFGVTADGAEDFESLTVRGWQRAGALQTFFQPARGPLQDPHLAVPTVIYASKPADTDEARDENSRSKRPLQTIAPLAASLRTTPNLAFGKGDEKALVADVFQQNGIVLISWQHERIRTIADHVVGSSVPSTPIPVEWPDDRFDIVWVFTPPTDSSSQRWGFVQVPQCLLTDDASTVIEG